MTDNKIMTMQTECPDFLKNKTTSRGSEDVTMNDVTLPRLEIVQSLSPCKKKTDPSYIPGAEEGMLFNNLTRELYGSSVNICLAKVVKQWLLWVDRKSGGGFKGAYNSHEEAFKAKQLLPNKEQVDIVETAVHFGVLIKDNGKVEDITISMSKSKLKANRKINSLVKLAGGDRWDRVYKCSVITEKSDLGEYYNLDFALAGYPTKEIHERAEGIYGLVQSGAAKMSDDYETTVATTAEISDEDM